MTRGKEAEAEETFFYQLILETILDKQITVAQPPRIQRTGVRAGKKKQKTCGIFLPGLLTRIPVLSEIP